MSELPIFTLLSALCLAHSRCSTKWHKQDIKCPVNIYRREAASNGGIRDGSYMLYFRWFLKGHSTFSGSLIPSPCSMQNLKPTFKALHALVPIYPLIFSSLLHKNMLWFCCTSYITYNYEGGLVKPFQIPPIMCVLSLLWNPQNFLTFLLWYICQLALNYSWAISLSQDNNLWHKMLCYSSTFPDMVGIQ